MSHRRRGALLIALHLHVLVTGPRPTRLASLNRRHPRRAHTDIGLDLGPPDVHAQPEMLGRAVIGLCRDANLSVKTVLKPGDEFTATCLAAADGHSPVGFLKTSTWRRRARHHGLSRWRQ